MKFGVFSFTVSSLLLAAVTHADIAGDRFRCYRGFDSFPSPVGESKLKMPLFIIPVTKNFTNTTEEFIYLNEAGSLSVTTSEVPQEAKILYMREEKVDALSVVPPGETTEVEDLFLTQLDQRVKDSPTYVVPARKPCPDPKNVRSVCALVAQHKSVPNPKKLDMDVQLELIGAISRKATGNAMQANKISGMTGPTIVALRVEKKQDLPAIRQAYQQSLSDLDKCSVVFPHVPDIEDAVAKQKQTLSTIFAEIDRLQHPGPITGQPATPAGGNANNPVSQ